MSDTRIIPPRQGAATSLSGGRRAGGREESDVALMHRASGGDREPYSVLFRRHANRIWQTAFLILHRGASADDVVQETFARGLCHIRNYRGEAEPRAWFSSIALDLCRHILHDSKKDGGSAGPAAAAQEGPDPQAGSRQGLSSVTRNEGARILTVALGCLTEAQREVFVLHYAGDLPYEDIARILNIKSGAARALAHRARLMLQKMLGAEFDRTLQA